VLLNGIYYNKIFLKKIFTNKLICSAQMTVVHSFYKRMLYI